MYHLSFYKPSLLLFVLFSSLDTLLGERFTGKLQGSYRGEGGRAVSDDVTDDVMYVVECLVGFPPVPREHSNWGRKRRYRTHPPPSPEPTPGNTAYPVLRKVI